MADQAGESLDKTFTVMHAIHSLALADVYRKRYDDAVVHLKQLKGIMSGAEITSPSHNYVAEAMINIDGLISIETGRSPITVYSFDPGLLSGFRFREIETHLSMARNAPPIRRLLEVDENPPIPMISDATDFLADASTAGLQLRYCENLAMGSVMPPYRSHLHNIRVPPRGTYFPSRGDRTNINVR